MNKIAIIQRPSVLLDRSATVAVAVESIGEAATAGAELIVLPETFIPGYPSWIWRLAPGRDGALAAQLHARLLANAVDLGAGELDALCEVARDHRVTVVCGLNECERTRGGGTVYNTVVVIDADGKLRNRHRKLMPTNPERMVHALRRPPRHRTPRHGSNRCVRCGSGGFRIQTGRPCALSRDRNGYEGRSAEIQRFAGGCRRVRCQHCGVNGFRRIERPLPSQPLWGERPLRKKLDRQVWVDPAVA